MSGLPAGLTPVQKPGLPPGLTPVEPKLPQGLTPVNPQPKATSTPSGLYSVNPGVNVVGDYLTRWTKFGMGGIRDGFRTVVDGLANMYHLGIYDFDKGHHYAPNDPHLDGRAMDVDTINGEVVGNTLTPTIKSYIHDALAQNPNVVLGVPRGIYKALGPMGGRIRIDEGSGPHIHTELSGVQPGQTVAPRGFTPSMPQGFVKDPHAKPLPPGLTPVNAGYQRPPLSQARNPMDLADPQQFTQQEQTDSSMALNTVRSFIGKALDFQANLVAHGITGEGDVNAQMAALRHKIPGMDWIYQSRMPDTGVPALDAIQNIANHASQGILDATIRQSIDPLTYESLGYGAVEKQVGPVIAKGMMRAVNATPLSRWVFDQLGWGNAIARTEGAGKVAMLRGASNYSLAEGSNVDRRLMMRYGQVVDGQPIRWKNPKTGKVSVTRNEPLTDPEKVNVGQALDGKIRPGDLTQKEQTAYRQLRTLTAVDFHLRQRTAATIALRAYGKQLPAEEQDALRRAVFSGKRPVIPGPAKRVREPYGEPQPRSRVTGPNPAADSTKAWQQATQDLTPVQKAQVGKALGDHPTSQALFDSLPPMLKERAAQVKASFGQQFSPGAGEVTQLDPAQRSTFMPENQAQIESAERIQGLYDKIMGVIDEKVPYRDSYMPSKHFADMSEGHEGFTTQRGDYYDPRFEHRDEIYVTSPKQLQDGFRAMISNTGRQVSTRVLSETLGDILDQPEVRKLFKEEVAPTGKYRDDWDKIKDGYMAVLGYPRAGVVSMTPRHGFNVADLAVNSIPAEHLPAVMKEVALLVPKLMKADAKEYSELTVEGRKLGALPGNFREGQAFFQKFNDKIPWVGGKSIPVLSKWTSFNNRLVWAIDAAFKQAYAKVLDKSGEAVGLEAGGRASDRLVDYENLSNIQKVARMVAPFGTFRAGIPGAVLGGVVRRPAQSAFYNRLSGGTLYGDKPEKGDSGVSLALPTAEVGRGLTDIEETGKTLRDVYTDSGSGDYLRSSIGAPTAVGMDALQDLLMPSTPGKWPYHWASYGEPFGISYKKDGSLDIGSIANAALAGIPEAQAILSAMGIGRFQWKGLAQEALRQTTGTQISP